MTLSPSASTPGVSTGVDQGPRPSLRILYEHPDWFRPLFAELDRRGIPFVGVDARSIAWDPTEEPRDGVLFNRMSPSAWTRGAPASVFATSDLLARAEAAGVRVVNGSRAWATEISKIRQLELLSRAGVEAPASRAVQSAEGTVRAASELAFPVVVKPNVGGSGAGVRAFGSADELRRAASRGELDFGLTGVGVVQERFRSADGAIQRVEVVGGRVLYGIRVFAPEDEFNLCPADACRTSDGEELTRSACALDAADHGLRVERFDVPPGVAREVERIAHVSGIEVGGVEYVLDAVTGRRLYYDVNALSNFVADGSSVLGFDPFVRLVDWLETEVLSDAGAASGSAGAVR